MSLVSEHDDLRQGRSRSIMTSIGRDIGYDVLLHDDDSLQYAL